MTLDEFVADLSVSVAGTPYYGPVRGYYSRSQSHRRLFRGARDVGWYEPRADHVGFQRATTRTQDELAVRLAVPAGGRVLDAGYGEGAVARRLAPVHGLERERAPIQAAAERLQAGTPLRSAPAIGPRPNLIAESGLTRWKVYEHRDLVSRSKPRPRPRQASIKLEYAAKDTATKATVTRVPTAHRRRVSGGRG